MSVYDAVVVGGGFYGTAIAAYLVERRNFQRVLLIEREPTLLARASYANQARVHNGYHYPRSHTTAYRSRVNLPRFVRDFPDAVRRDFTKLYAVARRNSKLTARQFVRFCDEIGARLEPAPAPLAGLFEPRLVEAVFLVDEYAFDTSRLRARAERELCRLQVETRLGARVTAVRRAAQGLVVEAAGGDGHACQVTTRHIFNCTYSGLNHVAPALATRVGLKHEFTEMALMAMPEVLAGLGVTVMDGPFFSFMPFPARGLHTLSHVRYTPHRAWPDQPGADPYAGLAAHPRASRVDRMLRDVARYLPAVGQARHVDSLFEVKTVLAKNEGDDGRPILFERHAELPGCYSVLGGKIDNIYDILEKLDAEALHPAPVTAPC